MPTRKLRRVHFAVCLQWIATGLLLSVGLAALAGTAAGLLGYLPMLEMSLRFGGTVLPQAGPAIQLGVAILVLAVVCALPAGFRVLRLERSHRDFSVCMSDIADAYHACHAADRADRFGLASEYDAVKERILFLRQHPDLGAMEPEILEVAAQMSFASRELAETYSDENVARARGFLRHRKEEIALFEDRLARALSTGRELRRMRDSVESDEREAEHRLAALQEEFGDLLDDLGFSKARRDDTIVALPHATAAE